MTASLRTARAVALVAIAALVAAASLTSFAESYRGLFVWSSEHGLRGPWAIAWPLQVDVFIAVGEAALFVAMVDRWQGRHRAGAWVVTLAGLAVSVAGNVGHVTGHALTSRGTAAVPPLAAAAALAVGLGVLKRVVASSGTPAPETVPEPVPASAPVPGPGVQPVPAESNGHEPAARVFAAELAAGEVPSIRRIRAEMHCGQPRAREIQRSLEVLTPAGQSITAIRNEMRQGGTS
jgi:Protein of unknown function (DUF2637)